MNEKECLNKLNNASAMFLNGLINKKSYNKVKTECTRFLKLQEKTKGVEKINRLKAYCKAKGINFKDYMGLHSKNNVECKM